MGQTVAIKTVMPKFADTQYQLDFFKILKERVYAEIGVENIKGNWLSYTKAIFFVGGYLTLLGIALTVKLPKLLMLLDAAGMSVFAYCIGFCVMHDAIHGTLSANETVNRWFGYTLDMLGCSSYFWDIKHNMIHHTWPNVYLYDDDIDIPIMRTHIEQPWKPIHRLQHKVWYWVSLYSLTYIAWVYKMDFTKLKNKKIGESPRKPIKPGKKDLTIMITGKLWHVSAALIAPIFTQGSFWILSYLLYMLLTGFVISIVFQLAHLVEKVSFMTVPVAPEKFENANKVHQLFTTADFAVDNEFATFSLGGLNFQVEHHLFPEINSRHYPRMQKIVKATCLEYGMPYHCFGTFREGIDSHVRLLAALGKKPE